MASDGARSGRADRPRPVVRALAVPLGGVVLGLLGFGLLFPNFAVGTGVFLFFAVGLSLAGFWESQPRWRAYRDARRLGP